MQNTQFIKFPSLENTYRQKEIDQCLMTEKSYEEQGVNTGWIVTEKVHGCFPPNTRVMLPDGSHKTIKEIVDTKYGGDILSVNEKGELEPCRVIDWFYNGKTEDWLKIYYKVDGFHGASKRVLTLTPNHHVFSGGEYIEASKLNVGDKLEVSVKSLSLSKIQEQVLIGKMLGDGSLLNNSVSFGHTKEKEDYVDFTLSCLGSIAGNKQKDSLSGYGSVISRARSISSQQIADVFYNWDKSIGYIPKITLTPISLCFWYLDDGSIHLTEKQKPRASFATCNFNREGCENLLKSLARIGLNGSVVGNENLRVTLDVPSTEMLFAMICTLVPECMQYKIPEHFRGNFNSGMISSTKHSDTTRKVEATIEKIEVLKENHGKYDLETENHNYFANNVHVHNCNYSFWVTSDENEIKVQVAKRTSFITDDEKFFNHKPVLEKYRQSMIELYQHLECDTLVVYGELFGGNIQSGMSYPLEQDFVAFDVKVDGVAQDKIGIFEILRSFGIPTSPVIGVFDTLQEALKVNESFDSLLTRQDFNGDDKHKEAEGVVIEPNTPMYHHNGSRVYLKKKTKRFLEKSGKPTVKHKSVTVVSEQVNTMLGWSLVYLTESRFQSVVSKIGEVSIKDIGKIMGLMTQDIIEDLEKDFEVDVKTYFTDKQDSKTFNKQLMKYVQDFIKPLLLSM